jgi:hypothetical protein
MEDSWREQPNSHTGATQMEVSTAFAWSAFGRLEQQFFAVDYKSGVLSTHKTSPAGTNENNLGLKSWVGFTPRTSPVRDDRK